MGGIIEERKEEQLSEVVAGPSETGTALGIALGVLGLIAMMVPTLATIVGAMFLGAIVFASGVVRFLQGLENRGSPNATWQMLSAILAAVAGGLIVFFPGVGMLTLTMLLGSFFLVGGIMKIMLAIQFRRLSGWGWLCFSGIITTLLGGLLIAHLPGTATWALGLIIGIDLFVEGLSLIVGRGARGLSLPTPLARARAAMRGHTP